MVTTISRPKPKTGRATEGSPAQTPSSSVQCIKGIGPARLAALAAVGVNTVEDLLYYVPRRYLDRSTLVPIAQLVPDREATVLGTVRRAGLVGGRNKRFVMVLGDHTGFLQCVWFQGAYYFRHIFQVGDSVIVSGRVGFFQGKQIVHPEFDILSREGDQLPLHTGRIIPLYPSTSELKAKQLDSRGFRRLIKTALETYLPHLPESLPGTVIHQQGLLPLAEALVKIHFPETMADVTKARRRLAFDELFYLQTIFALRQRSNREAGHGIPFLQTKGLVRRLMEQLPFTLTAAQKRVIREIRADLKRSQPMHRLLQGDVGSGKTIVAVMAILMALENDTQAAFMAPTEILAEQHYFNLRELMEPLAIPVVFLVGGLPRRERERRLQQIATGEAAIVVGTHALIQADVTFKRLGLAIIDEQHRFGVIQRATLRNKGMEVPHLLVMTATPIPRTLALTVYGDLDVSLLDELPPGRKRIVTAWRTEGKRQAIYEFVRSQVEAGGQVYVVCPLVEESEKIDLKAATELAEHLQREVFPDFRVALLHGRMKSDEKEAIMAQFKAGVYHILVSTTVIEVGIDIPNASVMVVEHAERFGLAQLHQLRGRVGRGERRSYCILLAGKDPADPLSDDAQRRLDAMAQTQDGFKIAEIDLDLRGPGEFLGTRQSGLPELYFADIRQDEELLLAARQTAFTLVAADPTLVGPAHQAVRATLLRKYKDRSAFIEVG